MIEGVKNFIIVPNTPEKESRKAARKARRAANFEFRKQNTISGDIASVPDTIISGVALFGLTKPAIKMMQKLSSNLTPEENTKVLDSFDKAFNESILPKKGAEVIRVNEKTIVLDNNNPLSLLADKIKNPKIKSFVKKAVDPIESAKAGENAFFSPLENRLILPESKLSLTNFHEMGHALNCNQSKMWSTVQCLKPLKLLAPVIASAALFMNKKEETPEHKLTVKDKTINAFRTAAPYAVAAACLPEIAEEITASIKGQKIANKMLPKNLAKKVMATNAIGASTYIVSAAALALGTAIGIKVKDKVMAKRMAKAEAAQVDETQKQLLRECKNNKL